MNTRYTATSALVVTIIAATGAIIVSRLSAQTSPPAVPCTDSDGGVNLEVKGTAVGTPWDAQWNPGVNYIYGQEPDPTSPKRTTDNYTTHYDYCSSDKTQLNEGECNAEGKVAAYGHSCPYGCSDGACKPAPADAPPSITLSAQATSPTTWHPGGRGYFSWSVTDDKALQSVIITTSQMMYSGPTIDETWKCQGKTFCEEKVYVIVPSNPGSQFVTVTATDSTGQTATKTVNFEAPACTTDADCGGGSIQWVGAPFCGSPDSRGLNSAVMQYGVAATCKSGGICDTASQMLVKQQCAAGDVCGSYTSPKCLTKPQACIPNGEITYTCSCGALTVFPPSYWERFCCVNYSGGTQYTSNDICPPAPSSSSVSSPISFSPPLVQRSASSSIMSSASSTGGETGTRYTTPTPSGGVAATPAPSAPQAATPVAAPTSPAVVGTSPVAPSSSRAATDDTARSSAREGAISKAELQREWKSLKGKVNVMRKKVASVERNIASLEKKIDSKLRLLDRSKRKEVQKRVAVQIEQLEKRVASLEGEKEKLEQELEELRERWEEGRAMVE